MLSALRSFSQTVTARHRYLAAPQVFDIAEKDQRPDRVLGRLYEVLRTRVRLGAAPWSWVAVGSLGGGSGRSYDAGSAWRIS